MDIDLTKTEIAVLVAAAARAGAAVEMPDRLKPASQERLLAKLIGLKLVRAEGEGYVLVPAGYRAAGLKPPRRRRVLGEAGPEKRTSKQDLVTALLGRPEGASLSELTAATGWLPHTARAVLSRLRASGINLMRCERDGGGSTYRIAPVAKEGLSA